MASRFILRMTFPPVAASLLLLTIGTVAAWYTHRLQSEASEILILNVGSMCASEELEIGLLQIRTELVQFLLTGDQAYLDAIPSIRKGTDHWLEEAKSLATTPPEQEWTQKADAGYRIFFEEVEDLVGKPGDVSRKARARRLADTTLSLHILQPVHDYLAYNEEVMIRESETNQRLANNMVIAFLVLAVCGAAAGLMMGYYLARAVRRSMNHLSISIRDAAGRLNEVIGPVVVSANWDFAQLESTLEQMANHVGTVVERLQQTQREVLRADQLAAVGQLAAGMAHEIRNPLSAMKVLVDTAAECGENACLMGRDVVVLQEGITRVENLTQSFLDFARPPQPEKHRGKIKEMVTQAINLVAGRAEQQGVKIDMPFSDGVCIAEVDSGQVRQVMINLLLNALDATPSGGTITVQVMECEQAANLGMRTELNDVAITQRSMVSIDVVDTGCGLRSDLGDRIFEPFVSTKETGLGLGLSICKRIVEAHGGLIESTNCPAGGARFTVRLPAAHLPQLPCVSEKVEPVTT